MLDMRYTGSITPREMNDGTTRYRVRITNALGKRVSTTVPTLEMAEAVVQAYVAQFGPRRDTTLRTWGETFFALRETDTIHRSVPREKSVWNNHVLTAPFADLPLRSITTGQLVQHVDALLRKKALTDSKNGRVASDKVLSVSAARSAMSLLRQALSMAQRRGLIDVNPAATVTVPKRAKAEEGWTFLSTGEIAEVLSFRLRPEQRAIYTLAIYTGLRAGELWGLRWCDVDFDRPDLHVRRSYTGPTKGGRPRHVPLLPPALAALESWKRHRPGIGEALVFPAAPRKREDPGNRCHGQGFDAGWPRIARMLGRRVRFHDLRHSCASHLVMGSWRNMMKSKRPLTMVEVKVWLGHKSMATTEIYAHLSKDWLGEVVAEKRRAE